MIISKEDFIEALNNRYYERKEAKGETGMFAMARSDQVLALVDLLYDFGILREGVKE